VIAGCRDNRQSTGDYISVDVTKSYPSKELILQDFMEVEYIAMETSDEFVTQGVVRAIGNGIIAVTNTAGIDDGNIYLFDRNGKGLSIIYRRGQGPGEYTMMSDIFLDEENDEISVIDPRSGILVYDLNGNFKRSFSIRERTRFIDMYNYDKENFICLGEFSFGASACPFFIVSKHDGSINKEIQIPFIERAPRGVQVRTDDGGWQMSVITSFFHPLIPHHSDWILTIHSSDTVFRYLPGLGMRPFIVKTPSGQSMSRETFLFPGILTDRYYFMIALKEIDGAESPWSIPNHPVMATTNLVYDKQARMIFEPTVYNGDFSDKRPVSMFQKTADNSEIAFWHKIEAYELIDDFKKGVLNGRLKEIAAQLDEEDNPIIMLIKYKK
jgi:hypothetical protein